MITLNPLISHSTPSRAGTTGVQCPRCCGLTTAGTYRSETAGAHITERHSFKQSTSLLVNKMQFLILPIPTLSGGRGGVSAAAAARRGAGGADSHTAEGPRGCAAGGSLAHGQGLSGGWKVEVTEVVGCRDVNCIYCSKLLEKKYFFVCFFFNSQTP